MPFTLLHPDLEPVGSFDPATPILRLGGESLLQGGIYAWVRVEGWGRLSTVGTVGPIGTRGTVLDPEGRRQKRMAEFKVVIRKYLPGPDLAPADPEVLAWVERQGWGKAYETAVRRWFERRDVPEKRAEVERLQKGRRREQEREIARRNAEENGPGFWDELIDQLGEVLGIEALKETAAKYGRYVKWGVVGVSVIGGGLLLARVVEAVRHRE